MGIAADTSPNRRFYLDDDVEKEGIEAFWRMDIGSAFITRAFQEQINYKVCTPDDRLWVFNSWNCKPAD